MKASNRNSDSSEEAEPLQHSLSNHLEQRIREIALEFLDIIHSYIMPTITSHESRVYYLKLQADYTRYIAELSAGAEHRRLSEQTYNTYEKAAEIAICYLAPSNPVRINLMLNFSVFYYEVYNSPERACILAKAAFNHAVESGVLDFDQEDKHKDAKAILKLIKRNLGLWTNQAVAVPV